uniref:Uncharacterized protein n=1 Tax=Ditylenchus dipsaci TaxID=166011 RepID=A0A915CPP6_9BILA
MTFLVLTLIVFLVSVSVEAADESSLSSSDNSCSLDQLEVTPCRCCKMDCWYTIAKVEQRATHELGHVPGQEGEDEAMATLRLIRACMITQCSNVCPSAAPRLFRPMSSSGKGNTRPVSQLPARSYPIAPML